MKQDYSWINEHIGDNIRKQRALHGVTQEQLADEIGISRASLVNIENGRHRCLPEYIFHICQIFNCDPNTIFPTAEYQSKVLIQAQEILGKRREKCHCQCHSNPHIRHIAACCNNGYIEY